MQCRRSGTLKSHITAFFSQTSSKHACPKKHRCHFFLQEYDEVNELVIADANDTEEAARNREIVEKLEASIAAAVAAGPRGRGRGGRGTKRSRYVYSFFVVLNKDIINQTSKIQKFCYKCSRGGRGGRGKAAQYGVPPPYYAPGARRTRSLSFAGEDGEADDSDMLTGLFQAPVRQTRRQCAKSLQRLLDNRGSWEAGDSRNAHPAAVPPPTEAWEALAQYGGPEATQIAINATDLATCANYFDDTPDGQAMAGESDAVARLAVALVAAGGTVANEDVFVGNERKKLGLEGAPPPPDPEKPLGAEDDVEMEDNVPQNDDDGPLQLPEGQAGHAVAMQMAKSHAARRRGVPQMNPTMLMAIQQRVQQQQQQQKQQQ